MANLSNIPVYLGTPGQVLKINSTGTDPVWADDEVGLKNLMCGKVIRNFGDSIAYGDGYTGGYAKLIAGIYTGSSVTNSAVNGSSLAPITGRSNIRTTILSDSLSDANYILIDGGINDAWEGTFTNYGTVSNSWTTFDTDTTAGALEDIFRYIYATKPSAVTVYVFPHDGMLSESSDWHTKVKPLILKILNKWNIPYVDIAASTPKMGTYGISGLSTIYTSDGVHPNQAGYERFYRDTIAMKMLYPFNETPLSNEEDSPVKEVLLTNTQLTTTGVKFERTTSQVNIDAGDYVEAVIDLTTCDGTDQELISLGCDIANWAGLNFHLYKVGTTKLQFQSCHTSSASWTENDEIMLTSIPDTSNIVVKISKGNMSINGTNLPNASKTTSGVAAAIWSQITTDGHMEIGCCQSPKTVTIKSLTIKRTTSNEKIEILTNQINELRDLINNK